MGLVPANLAPRYQLMVTSQDDSVPSRWFGWMRLVFTESTDRKALVRIEFLWDIVDLRFESSFCSTEFSTLIFFYFYAEDTAGSEEI